MIFKDIKKFLGSQNEFSRRIRRRHRLFWTDPNAEAVRNAQMSKDDPIEAWMDGPNWQRRLSNKYNAKQFAEKLGCNVANLYWKGSNPDDINFKSLPEHYVIRPTIGHSSRQVFIMNKGFNLFDQKFYTPEVIRSLLKESIKENSHNEFLIEEFLQEEPGAYKILNDYKFFCFNGEIASCQLINRTGPKAGFGSFYDENWNPMTAVHPGYPLVQSQPKPDCLEQMIAHVKALSRAYEIFVRIDFYATEKGAVFGEFTPTPGLGNGYSRYGQRLLISYWDKYCNRLV
jgi:hypothetical protein